jgi:hypothetical protein
MQMLNMSLLLSVLSLYCRAVVVRYRCLVVVVSLYMCLYLDIHLFTVCIHTFIH